MIILLTALRLGTLFFLSSFLSANWLTRMPDLLLQLDISKQTMGFALFLGPVGALIAAPLSGPLMDRAPPARVSIYGIILASLMVCGIGLSMHWSMLSGIVFFFAVGQTWFEIGGNAAVQRLEVETGNKYMAQCHGYWSLGFVCGALSAGAFGQFGVPLAWHLGIIAVLGVAGAIGITQVLPMSVRGKVVRTAKVTGAQTFALPSVALIGVGLMAIGVTLAESAVYDWGTLFLREQLQPSPFWTSVAYGTFPLTMFFGRLGGDWFRARYRAVSIVRVCATLTTIGLIGFIVSPHVLTSALSLALMGIGVSLVMPISVAAAGDKPGDPARNVAAMSMLLTAIFLLAPPGVGFVAEHFGLTMAFVMMVPFAILSGIFAFEAEPRAEHEKMIGEAGRIGDTNASTT